MNIVIHFHRGLQKYTNGQKEIVLQINDFQDLYSGLELNFPELSKYIRWLQYNATEDCREFIALSANKKEIIPEAWYLLNKIPEHVTDLWMIPSVFGSGGKGTGILIGLAFIAAAFFTAGLAAPAGAGILAGFSAGIAGSFAKVLLGIGLNLLLSSIFSENLKNKKPDNPTIDAERRNNDIFEALTNTTNSGTPVPLNYGLMRVAGHYTSGYIATVERTRDQVISVIDSVTEYSD